MEDEITALARQAYEANAVGIPGAVDFNLLDVGQRRAWAAVVLAQWPHLGENVEYPEGSWLHPLPRLVTVTSGDGSHVTITAGGWTRVGMVIDLPRLIADVVNDANKIEPESLQVLRMLADRGVLDGISGVLAQQVDAVLDRSGR